LSSVGLVDVEMQISSINFDFASLKNICHKIGLPSKGSKTLPGSLTDCIRA
jgi:hypothetical protein